MSRYDQWRMLRGDTSNPELLDYGKKLLGYVAEQRRLSGNKTMSVQRTLPGGTIIRAWFAGDIPCISISTTDTTTSNPYEPTDLYAYIANYPTNGDLYVYNLTKETGGFVPKSAFPNPNQVGQLRKDIFYKMDQIYTKSYDTGLKTHVFKLKLGKLTTSPDLLYPAGASGDFGFGDWDAKGNIHYRNTDFAPVSYNKLDTRGNVSVVAVHSADTRGMTVSPDGKRIYTAMYGTNRLAWARADNPDNIVTEFAVGLSPHPMSGPYPVQCNKASTRLYAFSALNSRLHCFNTVNDQLNRVGVYAPGYNCAQDFSISHDEKFAVMHAGNGPSGGNTTTVVDIDETSVNACTAIKTIIYKHPDPGNTGNNNAITTGARGCDVGPDNLIYLISQRTSTQNLGLYLSVFRGDAESGSTAVKHIRIGDGNTSALAHDVIVTTKFPYKPPKVT